MDIYVGVDWDRKKAIEQLDVVCRQLAQVEGQLEERLAEDEQAVVLRSMSGVGLQLSANLLALCFEGVDLTQRDAASVRLGSSPVTRHSGQQRHRGVQRRRSVGARAQQVSYLLGLQAVRHLPWAQAMYAAGRKRGQSAGTAFRRVSRSLLRILTAMLRDGQVYDEARYVRALQAKGVHWAQEL